MSLDNFELEGRTVRPPGPDRLPYNNKPHQRQSKSLDVFQLCGGLSAHLGRIVRTLSLIHI